MGISVSLRTTVHLFLFFLLLLLLPFLAIHVIWLTPGAARGFTDVPKPGMWVKGHSAGYRWERPFWGNGISSCGEACTPPRTRLGLFNKIRRRRVPAWPKHDARFYENRLLVLHQLMQSVDNCFHLWDVSHRSVLLLLQNNLILKVLLVCFSGPHLHLRASFLWCVLSAL